MSRYRFGANENLKCFESIQVFTINTRDGAKDVCFAAKIKTDYIILPWRTYVDDYVFNIKGSSSYYVVNRSMIQQEQSEGNLPETLPKYSLTSFDLLWGYSLWIFILVIAMSALKKVFYPSKDKGSQPSTEEIEGTDEDK